MTLSEVKAHRCFGGSQQVLSHESSSTKTPMRFGVYLPEGAQKAAPVPWLLYLSGLTCTEANFMEKAGAQRYAAEHGLALVAPDTSPRGLDLPGEHESYDFGSGAGFYLNATQKPWSDHYQMYRYVTEELPNLVCNELPLQPDNVGVFGHSMGGHGALVCAFRNPERFKSVSAFAPICNPSAVPWGKKAFSGYLGSDTREWEAYDATLLAKTTAFRGEVLIDQGLADEFLTEQLKPETLEAACKAAAIPLKLRRQPGYDHSYYFIASFMGDHVRHHAAYLKR